MYIKILLIFDSDIRKLLLAIRPWKRKVSSSARWQLFLQGDIVLPSLDRCPLGQTFSMLPSMTFDEVPSKINEQKNSIWSVSKYWMQKNPNLLRFLELHTAILRLLRCCFCVRLTATLNLFLIYFKIT